jgi:hypothetical protein
MEGPERSSRQSRTRAFGDEEDDPATAEPVGIEPSAHLDMDSDKDSGEKP